MLARRAATNEVVVGRRDELAVGAVTVRGLVDRGLGDGDGLLVQLRYRSPAVPVAALERLGAGRVRVRLGDAFAGAAPGQSAVFYRDGVVVGGGILAEAERPGT